MNCLYHRYDDSLTSIFTIGSVAVLSVFTLHLSSFLFSLQDTPLDDSKSKDLLKHRALALGSIASRHFFEGEPSMAVMACDMMADIGPMIRESGLKPQDLNMPWTRIIRGAAFCESGRRDGSISPCEGVDVELPCNLVYAVLNAMATFPSDNNDRAYEALSNALVRRVLFVIGAVDMTGCPPPDRGEAAFIGRSNVGKSSLVNMVSTLVRYQGDWPLCQILTTPSSNADYKSKIFGLHKQKTRKDTAVQLLYGQ